MLRHQQKQFSCLYRIHERCSNTLDLEDEPKNIDVKKLVSFKIDAAKARISILGFTEILRSKDHGYANPGEENNDLGIQDQTHQTVPQTPKATLTNHDNGMNIDRQEMNSTPSSVPLESTEPLHLSSNRNGHDQQAVRYVPSSTLYNESSQSGFGQQSYDVWPPFFYPTMLDVPPDSEMLNLSEIDMGSTDLDYFDFEQANWFAFTNS